MNSIEIAIAALERAKRLRPPSEKEAREAFEHLWSPEERAKHSSIGAPTRSSPTAAISHSFGYGGPGVASRP